MKTIGVSELRSMNAATLRELREILCVHSIVHGRGEEIIAVLIPYQTFMEMQTQLSEGLRKLKGN